VPTPPPSGNPFLSRQLTPNHQYAEKLESVIESFQAAGDAANAAKAQAVQETGVFYWISNMDSLPLIDEAVDNARAHKQATGEDQIVGLVLYDLPGRDCGAGESAGELEATAEGLERYKKEYVAPFEAKVAAATDVDFAIILEPDSLGNAVTNAQNGNCATAVPIYEEGVAHAIARLQFPHVHLYIDAANGGWLGWDADLEPAAREFAKVVDMAKALGAGEAPVRGFSINVSNYNQLNASPAREAFTDGSQSFDEAHYAKALSAQFEKLGLPQHFIVDQARVASTGARQEWGDWCNVAPAGYGAPPGSPVDNPLIDSIVWVKPGGESDGACGMEGAPAAGQWFSEYAAQLVRNADPLVGA
jgi:cellulose 1,4-beta-cellobiosidase